jgi:hypothetical protein
MSISNAPIVPRAVRLLLRSRLGALWEIFEFGMDRAFGMNMLPATPGDPSGLTDTITISSSTRWAPRSSASRLALPRHARASRVDNWAKRFIERNPQLFGD